MLIMKIPKRLLDIFAFLLLTFTAWFCITIIFGCRQEEVTNMKQKFNIFKTYRKHVDAEFP